MQGDGQASMVRCSWADPDTHQPRSAGGCLQKWGMHGGNHRLCPPHCSAELPAGALET